MLFSPAQSDCVGTFMHCVFRTSIWCWAAFRARLIHVMWI